jgi:hypothetical protein
MGILTSSGVGALPRIGTPLLAALTLAGNNATSKSTRHRPAGPLVAGIMSPTAPRPSRNPVRLTRRAGLGNTPGTMAMRSSLALVKWELAVNKNIVARAHATTSCQVERAPTPKEPNPPNNTKDTNSTTKTTIRSYPSRLLPRSHAIFAQFTYEWGFT